MDGKVPYRFRKNEPMAFLESHLFRYQKDRYEKKQDRIHILHASSPGDEVEAAARQVRHLVRTKGWRYRDFAVIVPDLSAYSDEIRTRFSQYGIPVFMDQKRSVLLNPFVEYVRSVLAMIQKGFTYESVFRFLRTGLFEFTMEEVDTLENYVLALGIRGYKRWKESWIRKSAGMSEEELVEVNCLRIRFVEQWRALSWYCRSDGSLSGISRRLSTIFSYRRRCIGKSESSRCFSSRMASLRLPRSTLRCTGS